MLATLYLFACGLATAQSAPADLSDGALMPRLGRGQELVYRGSYAEDSQGVGVQFNRSYRLETRTLVLDVQPRASDVVFLTIWKGKPAKDDGTTEVSSVYLEKGRVDSLGKVTINGGVQSLVLDAPPAIEHGAFVEAPHGKLHVDRTWDVADGSRPLLTWRVAGVDSLGGARCVKLIGNQQSDDWDRPRADRASWRRQETVWMTPRAGYAQRLERTIERRDPGRKDVTFKSVLRYELESSLQYPGQLFEDRRREVQQALTLSENVTGMLPRAGELGPRPFEAILKRMEQHCNQHPPTPYREALRRVQLLAEKGKRGEVPPEAPSDDSMAAPSRIIVGRTAPDFLVNDVLAGGTARLRKYIGKPILLVFYNPESPNAEEVLRFAQKIFDDGNEEVTVIGMLVSDDTEMMLSQRTSMGLTFPTLSGTGLRLSYAVEGTPKLVVIDAAGYVRGNYTGWGPDIPRSAAEDLKRCRER